MIGVIPARVKKVPLKVVLVPFLAAPINTSDWCRLVHFAPINILLD